MESKVRQGWNKKRICALLTLIIIIANMFSPYGVLFKNRTYAKEPAAGEPYFTLTLQAVNSNPDSDTWDEEDEHSQYYYYDYDPDIYPTLEDYINDSEARRAVSITLNVSGTAIQGGGASLKFNTSKLIPAVERVKGSRKESTI